MFNINSLQDLIKHLEDNKNNPDLFIKIMESINFSANELSPYFSWNNENYTRNLILNNGAFDLLVLCWSEQQESCVHNHQESLCIVHIAEGELTENIYNKHVANNKNHLDFQHTLPIKQKKKEKKGVRPNTSKLRVID